jgi:uncharacterized protein YutE (UPF0331/DUF86 family)
MAGIPEGVRRLMISQDLRALFEATIQERVNRHLEVSPREITANHHFTKPLVECDLLYTDGYFYSTVMVAQSVAEGISRFVAECNGLGLDIKMSGPKIVDHLVEEKLISKEYKEAFKRLWETRNDVHHMNPEVGDIRFPELAKRSIQDLTAIEREIFAGSWSNDGKFIPTNPKYWETRADGKIGCFLRFAP